MDLDYGSDRYIHLYMQGLGFRVDIHIYIYMCV